MRQISFALSLLCALFFLAGCELAKNHLKMDRERDLEFQDYRDALASREVEPFDSLDGQDGAIPDLQPYVSPASSDLRSMPLVSISVNQTIPLRDALFELAREAGYDIELDPRITGSVIFVARERPFDLVIEKLSEIAGLRYKFDEGSVRVELDTPYAEIYKVDYLSLARQTSGSISNTVSVASGGDGANAGSDFNVSSSSDIDFWRELETNLSQILGGAQGALRSGSDPQISVAEPSAPPVQATVPAGAEPNDSVQVQSPQAVLNVQSLPPVSGQSGTQGSGGTEDSGMPQSGFSMNKQAGIVSVFATQRQHRDVRTYLNDIKKATTAQVLIEARVVEVALDDEFSAGIDWGAVTSQTKSPRFGFGLDVSGESLRPQFDNPSVPGSSFVAFATGRDLNLGVEAISRFGTIRALASPRLTVLNNQSALLNVATNEVYFDIDVDVTRDTEAGTTQVDITTEIKTVPEGVLINVQPAINLETGEISMSVRPTVTRIVRRIPDPTIAFVLAANDVANAGDLQSLIPVVNVQQVDSIVQMRSGETLVMGGLMQDRVESQQNGIPVLGEVPLFGSMFRSQKDRIRKTELVIFLRATVIKDGKESIHPTDEDIYRTFSQDRRPIRL